MRALVPCATRLADFSLLLFMPSCVECHLCWPTPWGCVPTSDARGSSLDGSPSLVLLGAAFVCNEFVGKTHEPFGVFWVGDLGSDECIPRPTIRQTSEWQQGKLESTVRSNFAGRKVAVQGLNAVSVHPDSGSWRGSRRLLDLLDQHFFTVHWLCFGPDRLSVGPILHANRGGFRSRRHKSIYRLRCDTSPAATRTNRCRSSTRTKSTIPQPIVDCGSVKPDSLHGMMIVL